jgi:hypothetical protein
MYRLAISSSLWNRTFSSTSSDSDAVNDITLFCLVAETTGFIWTRRMGCTVNYIELTVFPASNTKKETKNVGLFVLVKL